MTGEREHPLRDEVVKKLKAYFEAREDVVMAFLFGSLVRYTNCAESDIDLAVYFRHEAEGWSGRTEIASARQRTRYGQM